MIDFLKESKIFIMLVAVLVLTAFTVGPTIASLDGIPSGVGVFEISSGHTCIKSPNGDVECYCPCEGVACKILYAGGCPG